MAHFKNFAIDEQNRLREIFLCWNFEKRYNCHKGEDDMFGGSFESNNGGGEFEPIPKGRYACTLDNACIDETKANKTPFLNITCTIADGKYANRKLWCKLWLTEGAYNMTAQQLSNLMVFDNVGTHATIDAFGSKAAELVFALVGKKIEVSVTGHDKYNDKKYEKTFITGFLDMPNSAIQTANKPQAAGANVATTTDTTEEIPF